MGYVYLLEFSNEDGTIYKIGFTKKSVQKRIDALPTGNPYQIKELYSYQTKYNQKLERAAQRFYSHCKLKGEWFNFDLNDVTNFITICEKLEHNFDLLKDNHFFKI